MHNSGTWEASAANATKVKWNLAPMPKGPAARGSMAEANTICVTSASKNPDMAWEFAKVDASKEGGIFHLDMGVTPGGRPDVYNDAKVQEKYFWMKVWAKIWEDALPFNGPANYRGSEASDTMKQGLDPIWIGQATPDSGVLDKVNDAVQKVLDKSA
jgi:multiple sugar transport system substrate-binding protein